MKKLLIVVGVIAAVLALGASTVYSFAHAPEKGSMGIWGYIVSPENAGIELGVKQLGVNELTVDKVTAPEDAWVVVHLDNDGMPGKRVGLQHISKGVSTDVRVKLERITSEKVIVAVHADRATPEKFDFDMEKATTSADRPFFVNGKELAKFVTVRTFGVKAKTGEALIETADQAGATNQITIDRVISPTPAWVVVHQNDDGMPGKRIGFTHVEAGESVGTVVKLASGATLTDSVLVAVHADRGVVGQLEFDMEHKVGSPDQPFFVAGKEVATKIAIK